MDRNAVNEFLAKLGAVTEEVAAEAGAADARMSELTDASEELLEQRIADGIPRTSPDPRFTIAHMRSSMAITTARWHRDAAREFAAWWADVATIAVVVSATGQLVPTARVAAADPTGIADDGVGYLPEVPEETRSLTRLTATFALPDGLNQADPHMAALANEQAARAGLKISHTSDGEVVVLDDGEPEARRRRLWGDLWIEARVPGLPDQRELADLLNKHGAPASTVADAVEALREVEEAAAAMLRIRELEQSVINAEPAPDADDDDWDALWSQAEQLTALLVRYASVLTDAVRG
ncbi:hypothetical protein [Amycolatopsis sp. YIM 10]|uniref:hypothetical protein n=1 Tax=Amycolatopsis sp. YIM 10 TaxID=2653857 RepID=UPI001290343E|nr:hypothetical protein [Amycolatopsis sp. YIM 10]